MTSLPVLQGKPVHTPGPKEQALVELWPIARKRLYRWGFLRKSLSLRRRFQLRLLRLGELKVKVPTGQTPDCESCTELCCTGPNSLVSLRLRDIAALTDAGLARFILRERPAVSAKNPTWARREADSSVFHQVFPVLLRDATSTCALLTEDRQCGAFPAWPLSCARYPYALDLESRVVFWASGCASSTVLPASEAAPRVRELVRAVVDSYNERVKDVILLHLAREELQEIGLLDHLRLDLLR